jgi:hypothetical protein
MSDSPVPASARVIGILAIIFSSLGLISALTNIGGMVVWRSFAGFGMAMSDIPPEFPTRLFGGALFLGIVGAVGGLAGSSLGLAGGIALLRRRPRAIPLMNIYAIVTIVLSVGTYIGSFAVARQIAGAISTLPEVGMTPGIGEAIRDLAVGLGGVFGFLGVVFGSAFPVIVLIMLNRDVVREAYKEA